MTISDQVQSATSIVAVVIAALSWWWSARVQHNADKPYVVAYLKPVRNYRQITTYLVLKNFGKTGAYVSKVKASKDIINPQSGFGYTNNPFEEVDNLLIAPGQSVVNVISMSNEDRFKSPVVAADLTFKTKPIGKFHCYKRSGKFHLDIKAAEDMSFLLRVPNDSKPSPGKEIAVSIYETSNDADLNRL